ncbi:hypothetical protein HYFRA_00006203 [Hymenoscyphus fraxineus]|uniref:GPI inositol-deacylase winged helix domain-containing protein n=1 Tax=Hymenoscyphus fraxineus TaxID=746836 RepID=A0A9N9LAU2_9HELO|nr:hypothetical protein HYFRA_00006203 [Hymenoscyphus fraxineus]
MEALYDRMASGISENISSTDKALAKTLLECVSSSLRVLTVAELSQAVDKDTLEILDFQRSIATLFGGFVVIDNSGNVAMIHRTAREYLLGGDRPFNISREAANERLFLSCIRCLMAVGLRTEVNRNERPIFLEYSSYYFHYY